MFSDIPLSYIQVKMQMFIQTQLAEDYLKISCITYSKSTKSNV